MPRIKRHPPACQSTPTQDHANSEGTSQSASQISPQSEPVAHTTSSTQNEEAPSRLPIQFSTQDFSDTELGDTEEFEDQGLLTTTSKRKCNTMWTVNVRGIGFTTH